ncbi:hypothetical protein AB0B21_40855, partial [Streptomyces rimosus]
GTADVAMNALGVETENRLGKPIMSGLHGMWSAAAPSASGPGRCRAVVAGPPAFPGGTCPPPTA